MGLGSVCSKGPGTFVTSVQGTLTRRWWWWWWCTAGKGCAERSCFGRRGRVGLRAGADLWFIGAYPAGDSNGEIADEDLVRRRDRRGFADLAAVHVGPVGAAQIFHRKLAILQQQATVVLGDVALGKDDVIVPDPSHPDLGLVEGEILGLSTFLGQRQDQHMITLSKNAPLVYLGRRRI
jgi:hypothetical protein